LDYEKDLEETNKRLPGIYQRFTDIFAPKYFQLPEHGKYDLAIITTPDAKLPKVKQRPKTREQSQEIIRQVNEWKRLGRVRESRSDSASDVLFIPKKDGRLRMCIDYRLLNAVSKKDENKSQRQDQVKDQIQGAKWYTKIDIRDGYHNLRIRRGDEEKTAFLTPIGLYECTVMWFGLQNAPAEFARYMQDVLSEFVERFVAVYFDDITVYSDDEQSHIQHVTQVLERIEERRIKLKIQKCEFHKHEIELLGERISGKERTMLEDKVKAILDWQAPKSLKDIERWRGLAGYYRQYIYQFSKVMEPINKLLKTKEFRWTEIEQQAFDTVKEKFKEGTILLNFDFEKQIKVTTDASGIALGAVIEQQNDRGNWQPVLFYSRKFNDAELRYSNPDKELLAIVAVFRKYPHYLKGTRFPVIVKSDHKNLRTFTTSKALVGRQVGWMEELSDANFVIEHIRGKENVVADALSRRPDYQDDSKRHESAILKESEGNLVIAVAPTQVIELHDQDMDNLLQKFRTSDEFVNKGYKDMTCHEGLYYWKSLIVVPRNCERDVMRHYHESPIQGHPGTERMMEKIQKYFYIPKLYRKTKAFILNCDDCQKNKEVRHKPYGYMNSQEEDMSLWSDLSMDFMEGLIMVQDPLSHKAMSAILVIVDRLSKYAILIPTWKDLTVEELKTLLLREVFKFIGFPKRIISDRDKLFRSELWQNITKAMGTNHRLSTSHHQQTDGQTERKIQEIIQWLRHYLDFNQENWLELLPVMQLCLNESMSTTTGATPSEIVWKTSLKTDWSNADLQEEIKKANIIREALLADINWERMRQTEYYNERRMGSPSLKVGDRVYLKRRTKGNKSFNIRSLRPSQKLDHVQYGPFAIEGVLENDNYKLKLPSRMQIYPVFHISLLEPTEIEVTGENNAMYEGEFEVEKIVGKRTVRGVTHYKVRWLGCDPSEDTWEPTKHLACPQKIEEFEKRNPH
jgi:hypothetical protein